MSVIDGSTNQVIDTINLLPDTPGGVGVNSTTNRIYAATTLGNSVIVIDGSTNQVTDTITIEGRPEAIGVNPETNLIYVVNKDSNNVTVIKDDNAVSPDVTPTPTPGLTLNEGPTQLTFDSGGDTAPAWSPTGNTIVFSSNRGNASTNTWDIWAIDADGNNERQLAEGPDSPIGIGGSLNWIGNTGDLVTNERVTFHEYMRFKLSETAILPVVRTVSDGDDAFFTRLLLIPGGLGGDGIEVSKDGTQVAW